MTTAGSGTVHRGQVPSHDRRTGDGAVAPPVVEVRGLAKYYAVRTGFFRHGHLVAAEQVSFSIARGETLALVGESGSGKSTVGKCILRLEDPSAGDVALNGEPVTGIPSHTLRHMRAQMQMVFQDPLDSLNPRKRVWTLVAEPLWLHGLAPRSNVKDKAAELFELVGLSPDHLDRYPHQLSGGQQQRVGIARALATNPAFAVLDEPTSALDVSVQAQLIKLLRDLQQQLQLSYLFITHDLALATIFSARVAVMYLGHIMELGSTRVVLSRPFNPYTRALISATPVDNPWETRERITLVGEPSSPIDPPVGCRLAPRCPYVLPKCRAQPIPLAEVLPGHAVRCIRFQEEHANGVWEPEPTVAANGATLGHVPHAAAKLKHDTAIPAAEA
jgi:oligopeptide/dipeptide ABC transporter ATP-binding protein